MSLYFTKEGIIKYLQGVWQSSELEYKLRFEENKLISLYTYSWSSEIILEWNKDVRMWNLKTKENMQYYSFIEYVNEDTFNLLDYPPNPEMPAEVETLNTFYETKKRYSFHRI